ncbi:hypothetical protein IHE33_01020 [Mycetohabitans endofungorum]|uniref:hypothetical protein n=1 Tax=Mycetohabitans endofungorum TaxID=417203 RepID=UPI0030D10E56
MLARRVPHGPNRSPLRCMAQADQTCILTRASTFQFNAAVEQALHLASSPDARTLPGFKLHKDTHPLNLPDKPS